MSNFFIWFEINFIDWLNVENLTNISKMEMEKMEQLYKKLIHQVFNLSRTTPYRWVLNETGNWSCQKNLNYKKLMVYYYI